MNSVGVSLFGEACSVTNDYKNCAGKVQYPNEAHIVEMGQKKINIKSSRIRGLLNNICVEGRNALHGM